MKIMKVETKTGPVDTVATEALVLTHCEGEALAKQDAAILDRALGGALQELVRSKEFEGKANEGLAEFGIAREHRALLRREEGDTSSASNCDSRGVISLGLIITRLPAASAATAGASASCSG